MESRCFCGFRLACPNLNPSRSIYSYHTHKWTVPDSGCKSYSCVYILHISVYLIGICYNNNINVLRRLTLFFKNCSSLADRRWRCLEWWQPSLAVIQANIQCASMVTSMSNQQSWRTAGKQTPTTWLTSTVTNHSQESLNHRAHFIVLYILIEIQSASHKVSVWIHTWSNRTACFERLKIGISTDVYTVVLSTMYNQ